MSNFFFALVLEFDSTLIGSILYFEDRGSPWCIPNFFSPLILKFDSTLIGSILYFEILAPLNIKRKREKLCSYV